MNAANFLNFLFEAAPVVIAVTLFLFVAAIVASIADAKPGGMVPRTMDPAASWR